MGNLYKIKRKLEKGWYNYKKNTAKLNKKAIWVFGMQKSGTTAIAALLAERAGKTSTLDTPLLWTPYLEKIQDGTLDLKAHIRSNPYDFSKDIIKEPNATFLFNDLKQIFELQKYVVIIRNPFDTIRSILNRLDLPGDKESIDIDQVNPNWRGIFKNSGKNYIIDLCDMWNQAYNNKEMINSRSCILVKYEDFIKDKIKFTDNLAEQFNLAPKNSIEHIKDKSFQPKGKMEVDLKFFFGINYSLIYNQTKFLRDKFNYK